MHDDLPRDARILLNTPRPDIHDIKTLSKDQYVHYDLLKINYLYLLIDNRLINR